MADQPQDQLTPAPPFTYVGVDYFGRYFVKEGRKEYKRYRALFTCLVSLPVHIEITHLLETDSFPNALRRFISRREPVRELRKVWDPETEMARVANRYTLEDAKEGSRMI